MSAAQWAHGDELSAAASGWRKAMNSGASAQAWRAADAGAHRGAARRRPPIGRLASPRRPRGSHHHAAGGVGHLVVLSRSSSIRGSPTPFFTFQIGAQSLVLGIIALSLMFLAGYGGMVSLAQMTVAGIAGYMVAIFGQSGTPELSLGWPWWVAVLARDRRSRSLCAHADRLALGADRGHLHDHDHAGDRRGVLLLRPAELRAVQRLPGLPARAAARRCSASTGATRCRSTTCALFWALAGYVARPLPRRAPFGLALQGIRDNPRRMGALGFNVTAHRIAAYAVAGADRRVGGVLLVWYNGLISPGSIGSTGLINMLIIAVLGGMRHPVGPFIGAVVFVLLQNFADRPGRPRALQPGDRRRLPGDRAVLARRAARAGGRALPARASRAAAAHAADAPQLIAMER